jgi:hypothetical protein
MVLYLAWRFAHAKPPSSTVPNATQLDSDIEELDHQPGSVNGRFVGDALGDGGDKAIANRLASRACIDPLNTKGPVEYIRASLPDRLSY